MAHGERWTYRGKTALITGASSGIGRAFAHELAGRGMDVVLVARSEERLRELADTLARSHGVRAAVIAADLSRAGAGQEVVEAVRARGLTVDLLVNNAGFGYHGVVADQPPSSVRDMMAVNMTTLVELSRSLVAPMLERGSGGIINVVSLAAFQPMPYIALYAATKAFVLSFSEALGVEVRGHGVRVLALCPGETSTAFFDTARQSPAGRLRRPAQVVASGLRALERGQGYVIDGWQNYLLAQLPRVVPRPLVVRVAARVTSELAGGGVGRASPPPTTADRAAPS